MEHIYIFFLGGGLIVCLYQKGAGDLNIKVDCMNQSETYSVIDAIYKDTATSDLVNNYTKNYIHTSISYNSDGYYVVTQLDSYRSTYIDKRNMASSTVGKTIHFLADAEFNNGQVYLQCIIDNETNYSELFTQSGELNYELDIPSDASTVLFRVYWFNNSQNDILKLKKFVIYSI